MKELEALYPRNPAPLINQGKTVLGRADRAVREKTTALDAERETELRATPPERRQAVREIYEKKKERVRIREYTTAREFFAAAVEKIPHVFFYAQLADLERRLGNLDPAEVWIRKAMKQDPADARVRGWLINLLMTRRKFEEAYKEACRAVERLPEHKGLQKLKQVALNNKLRFGKGKGGKESGGSD
jgi:tetratricopeptide (TPR) repeat protein